MTSIIENNDTLSNQPHFDILASHENKSCEKYTLSEARDMVNDLNNISLFLKSGAWRSVSEEDDDMLDSLLTKLQLKIESLESCLGYMEIYPMIKAQELAGSQS